MGLILQGNSDARAVWHHKHPVSWIIALKSTSCARALFKSGLGAVPVAAEPEGMAPLAAAYAPELAALGLLPTGKTLATERRVVATAPAENALTLALDRFLLPRGEEIGQRLAAEA